MSQVVIAAEIKKERVGGDSESERRIKKREKRTFSDERIER